ncbi:hypothetical protein IMSAGC020_02615 [Lachnospiraceae bacterium]|nr:hypothetical protein IMSAGC020_02615 [Lachnospiraceae bacterium]
MEDRCIVQVICENKRKLNGMKESYMAGRQCMRV